MAFRGLVRPRKKSCSSGQNFMLFVLIVAEIRATFFVLQLVKVAQNDEDL
jgi:hypothetical protein